ncbi:MAG: UDP-N-acetylmuramate dehydrogenase [Gaiellales bacterium]|jgi:UDP-N-acetylmuramate dehydrogenase|nr:UDP-N-acetylmuramate dehydrogenase [Gaiellales bacterium]
MSTRPASVEADAALARLTTIGTGGPARFLARPETAPELADVLAWAAGEGLEIAVIGLGSNLLVADEGYGGVALHLEGELTAIAIAGTEVHAGGGASLAAVVRRATEAGLAGIEFGCAIPGTVGGAVRMNAGAYGSEIRDVLRAAEVVSATGARSGGPDELELAYRRSNVLAGEVVSGVVLELRPEARDLVRARVRELQRRRSESQPRKARTFGSVFKNPAEGRGAGALIEACGLKGHEIGGARISTVHANFIENAGDARSADVAALVALARRCVRERFGVDLEHEVELLGPVSLA